MSRITYKEFKFECNNKDCENYKLLFKKYMWSNDPQPNCIKCGKSLDNYIEGKATFFIPKFSKMSPDEKRQVLKKRSNDHFKKHIEEKKRFMDNDSGM